MSFRLDLAQEELALLVDRMPVGVLIHYQGNILSVNPAFLEMLGYYAASDLKGRSALELVHAEDRGMVRLRMKRGEEGGFNPPMEERLLRRDGSHATVEVSGMPIVYDGRSASMALFRDLSKDRASAAELGESRKKQEALESSLRQAQKMEAVGQLAGGVAHDFNNVLMVITMGCELLQEELRGAGQGAHAHLEAMRAAAESAAGLTRQLLAFSRQSVSEPVTLNFSLQMASTKKLLRRVLPENIALEMEADQESVWVSADPSQMEQILLNLAVNARDAMPQGGRLAIRSGPVTLPAPAARLLGLEAGPYLRLSVQDDGSGMDEALKQHIFEPFFTTKGLGKGTGMGLATVYGIVKQAGGAIQVESAPGAGSRFDVYLPRVTPQPQAGKVPLAFKDLPGGHERILLVEDEAGVREAVGEALRTKGYEVITACSAEEALSLAASWKEPVGAMITDVVMPGMDGFKLAERMREDHGLRRIILMSGHADHMAAGRPGHDLFAKPVRLERILCGLRELLDRPMDPVSRATLAA